MVDNQLGRYGAIARNLDLAPGSKLFIVSDSDDTTVGPLNIGAEFPVDRDGVVRVYTTIQAAVNAAAANRGDLIKVLPGYDQSLTAADSWDKAGVTIEGVGRGTMRPTLRYTGTAGEVGLSANNIRVTGLRFLSAVDSCVRAVDLDTGFTGIHFDNNIFDFDTTTSDFRVMMRVGSKRSLIENNIFRAADSAPASGSAIRLKGGDPDHLTIKNNYFYGLYDTLGDTTDGGGIIVQDTTDTLDTNLSGLLIQDNKIVNTDTAAAMFMRLDGGGYRTLGLATGNIFAGFDSTTADTSKIASGTAVGEGVRFVNNHISGDSGTEKIIGDTQVVA